MIKAILWLLFILHTLTMSIYVGLGLLGKIQLSQFLLTILAICGILNSLCFGELVLRDIYERRNKTKRI